MYNSPIKTGLMYRELVKEVNKDTDEQIYKAVVACGVDVDRDELLRALRYDREQYDAGFTVGYRAATPKWIPVEERLPEKDKLVLCIWERVGYGHCGFARYQRDDVWYVSNEGMPKVTHWMPLPEPPIEEQNRAREGEDG